MWQHRSTDATPSAAAWHGRTAPRRRYGRWAYACSQGDDAIATTAATDGALLRAVPRWQAAAAADADAAADVAAQ
jgi:hypothetical protein